MATARSREPKPVRANLANGPPENFELRPRKLDGNGRRVARQVPAVQRLTDLIGTAQPLSSTTKKRASCSGRVHETARKYNPLVDQPPAGLELEEYRQLRATVRERGSLRVVLFVVTIAAWALVAGLVGTFVSLPLASLLPLLVLMAGFEAVHQLHIGVERIGRFLYVRYENAIARPMWETAIAAFGTGHRPSTRPADALFSMIFSLAIAVNFLVATLGATSAELIGVGAVHGLAVVRVLLARMRTRTQRAEDQKRFEDVIK